MLKQERRLLTAQRLPMGDDCSRGWQTWKFSGSVCHHIGTGLAPRADFFCAAWCAGQVAPEVVRAGQHLGGRSPGEEIPPIIRPQMQKPDEDRVRVNHEIRARQVRVIDEEGEQLGIMAPRDAQREAEERGLDLVEVAPKANPPVCRIMDYGKYKYEQKRRARESRKHQHTVSLKEVKFRPKIDPHDFEFKKEHVREFITDGNKVKVTVMFRGREMAHPEFGKDIVERLIEATKDIASADITPQQLRLEGRNMCLVLSPLK